VQLSPEKIKNLCKKNKLKLKELLTKAEVSPTAYYSLTNKDSVLPKSIHALAETLGVNPSDLLEKENKEVAKIRRLQKRLEEIMEEHLHADRENIWHTLLLMELSPEERLERTLRRGRKFNFYKERSTIS